jgi:hypothetical protein
MSYAKLRYNLDFDNDSPADAVGNSSTPVLLIHGNAISTFFHTIPS